VDNKNYIVLPLIYIQTKPKLCQALVCTTYICICLQGLAKVGLTKGQKDEKTSTGKFYVLMSGEINKTS
jgi:hypothetical protein